MTLQPTPTRKLYRMLTAGLTFSWRPLLVTETTTQQATVRPCCNLSMAKQPRRKDSLRFDGTLQSQSPSSAFCCIKCGSVVGSAANFGCSKWNAKPLTNESNSKISSRVKSPPNTIDKYMPKFRNGNQATTGLLRPAMHRKSKSKSKSTLGSGVMLSGSPTSHCSGLNIDTSESINVTHSKPHQQSLPQRHPQPRPPTTTKAATSRNNFHFEKRAISKNTSTNSNSSNKKKKMNSVRCNLLVPLPTLGATSFVTLLTVICIETVLLSTMSSCAKTFYMHWNTSNSIFRIDNTDHIIDVNKGNLAFEFDQVHIICPVYEPGAFENETEKYIIYNVSKVEYETCRITNADPRVIAICDKPQKLMFFTITFRPFTPQPGGLEFLPGNDYYFISTSSKDDLYRRIGGRCSTNNMKVVFKVCCAAEEKNKTMPQTTLVGNIPGDISAGSVGNGLESTGVNIALSPNINTNHGHGHGHNGVNTIGISGVSTGLIVGGVASPANGGSGGIQLKPINGMGTSINTNIDQFNRIPIQPNIIGNNIGPAGVGLGGSGTGTGGIMLSPGHGSINMLPPGRGTVHMAYPGHHHIQTGIRINNVPTQQSNPHPRGNNNVNTNGKDIIKIQAEDGQNYVEEVGSGSSGKIPINSGRDIVGTNHSNIIQSTINWPLNVPWGIDTNVDANISSSRLFKSTTTMPSTSKNLFHPKYINVKINITSDSHNSKSISNYTPSSHSPQDIDKLKNDPHNYDKHPNEVVKNEELTYNSGSGRTAKKHSGTYIWMWTWLLGSRITMGLPSMRAYVINSTVIFAMGVIIFHYLLGINHATLKLNQHCLLDVLGSYR